MTTSYSHNMDSNLTKLTSQYGCLKTLVRRLWPKDLPNLALTCTEIYQYVGGNKNILQHLTQNTARCDGSSGQAWKCD